MSPPSPPPLDRPLPSAPHFTLSELVFSSTAQNYGLDNTPSPAALERLLQLARLVLEPLRMRFGAIKVTSGYRSPELNWYVSLNRTSRHCRGEAADIRPLAPGVETPLLALWARANLPCGQIILYNFPKDWLHIDLAGPGASPPRLYVSQGQRSPAPIAADDLARLVSRRALGKELTS
ncbi:MAG: hypothetical protein KJ720_11345 [Proteobacteria bacterium]|nr:hypothetical protein [Pseudomonadota bacterium]MBU1449724.1 hypothetical protein [Pseudomonadota bacterium]